VVATFDIRVRQTRRSVGVDAARVEKDPVALDRDHSANRPWDGSLSARDREVPMAPFQGHGYARHKGRHQIVPGSKSTGLRELLTISLFQSFVKTLKSAFVPP